MAEEKIIEVLIRIIQAFSVNIVLFVIFAFLLILIVKIKKATWSRVIDFHQNFLAFSISIYIFALLPIYLSCFVWLLTFFILREFVFRKNEIRKYQIYSKYGKSIGEPEPKIVSFSQINDVFFSVENTKLNNKDFKYSFLSYSNTGFWLILFLFLEMVETSKTINLLFFIEIIIIASIIFIFIGRVLYHITYSNHGASEIGTHIVVSTFGVIYYFIVISILISVHGMELFSW